MEDDFRQRVMARGCWEGAEEFSLDLRPIAEAQAVTRRDRAEQRLAGLACAIEAEIIPRLVLARRAAPERSSPPAVQRAAGEGGVAELARLVLQRDDRMVLPYVEGVRARGMSVETVYLDLLAPTARYLGDLWSADLCDFTEVTVGVWRLQKMVHELGPAFRNEAEHCEHGRRILLAPAPGEQHSFGMFMVAEFFRRAGWDVWSGPAASNELVGMVRSNWFAVVGLSMSCRTQLEALTAGIRAIRRSSRNRAVGVMVGGPVFAEHPEFAALVGADATAVDGRQAAEQAKNLLALLGTRS